MLIFVVIVRLGVKYPVAECKRALLKISPSWLAYYYLFVLVFFVCLLCIYSPQCLESLMYSPVAYNESYEKKNFKFLFLTSTICPLFCGNGISDWSFCKCEYDGAC